ncbi:hypothetical protein CEXT_394161 [Caerostris extrusa]|uniref:Uncharacterized protein n=1 Tax=Caerostris extrusa TaxID=172846 RepID=A0AAV4QCJ8_CAEEX|nr:hypothetical protein CEXT_394161 [Caerostris extrusa]
MKFETLERWVFLFVHGSEVHQNKFFKEPDLHISALVTSTSEKLPLSDERNCSDFENSNFHVSIELGSNKLGPLSPQSSLIHAQISGKKILPRKRKKLPPQKKEVERSSNTREKN